MRISIAFMILVAMGCASSSLSEEYCNRAESCNQLGTSVEECVQDADRALDTLPQNQRDEVEFEFKRCLERPSCDGFIACVDALPR